MINSLESKLRKMSRLKKRNAEIAHLMKTKAAKRLKYKPSEMDVAPWCYGANKGRSETRYTDTGWSSAQELELSDISSSSLSTDQGSHGKKVEVAIKRILVGEEVRNKGALANPECLELYKNIPETKVW